MILCQSHQTHRRTFLAVNPGLATVWAASPLFVSDPFCIASHHPLQKQVDFVAIQKRFACIHTGKNVFCVKSCGTQYIELLFESNLLQMVYNGLMTHAQLLADATAATMPVSFDQFSDFIAIFDDRPSGP